MASDARIVREVLAGRQQRFGALVDRYQNLVNGVILARLGRVEEREDLVQTVFLKAFESLGALDEPERFAGWLRRIAENEAITYLRRVETRRRGVVSLPLPPDVETPDAQVMRREATAAVWEAMEVLTEAEREVILLHYFGDVPQGQIAAWLGVSVSAVKARLIRARERLRDALLDRKVRQAVRQVRLGRDFRRRVMVALPILALRAGMGLLSSWWAGWAGALLGAAAFVGVVMGGRAPPAPAESGAPAGLVRLATDDELARFLDRTRFGAEEEIGSLFNSSVLPDGARAREREALARGWGGELVWDFDGGDGGWQARSVRSGPIPQGPLQTSARDGILRVSLPPEGAGLMPTVILVSPELGYDSRLFDRVGVRFRAELVGPPADSGSVALMWTNSPNRMFPGARRAGSGARRRPSRTRGSATAASRRTSATPSPPAGRRSRSR